MLKLKKYDVEPLFHSSPVSDIKISPNGKTILFVKSTVNVKDDRYESHIWSVSTKGEKPAQFTNCVGNDTSPMWSHDGKIIYFLSNRSIDTKEEKKINRLWSISAQGGEARLIAEIENGIRRPKLSPDGKKLLFLARVEEDSEARSDKDSDVLWITKLKYKLNGEILTNMIWIIGKVTAYNLKH